MESLMKVALSPPGMAANGFTLLELLVSLLVVAILLSGAVQAGRNWLPAERVTIASNQVLGLMRQAQLRASLHGPVLLCDGHSLCERFDSTDRLLLADDLDGDGHAQQADIITRLRLPPDTTLSWSRFRGDALRYGQRGTLFYQNGHFLICNHQHARSLIMNVIGTVRIEPADGDDCPPL